MLLKSVDDSRDPLMKLSRKECEHLAVYKNVPGIEPGMPKPLMIRELRLAGIDNFKSVTDRGLGVARLPTPTYEEWVARVEGKVIERVERPSQIHADDILANEWKKELSSKEMTITQLRSEAKRRGIKYPRTAKRIDLIDLLNENPSR